LLAFASGRRETAGGSATGTVATTPSLELGNMNYKDDEENEIDINEIDNLV
jgi:hypothetical protein